MTRHSTFGFALGGGAALGWAHIGVVRALEEEFGIVPSHIAGTSIGAIVGGGVAAGALDRVEEVARSLTLKDMLSLGAFSFKRGAIIGTGKILDEFKRVIGDWRIEDLPLPYAAVSTDLYTAEPFVHDKGDLITAMQASSALPALFPPVEFGDKLLIDGGAVEQVPVGACKALGASHVIAVSLQNDYAGALKRAGLVPGEPASAIQIGKAAVLAGIKSVAQLSMTTTQPDIVLSPKVGGFDPSDFTKADELIAVGRQSVMDARADLEALVARET